MKIVPIKKTASKPEEWTHSVYQMCGKVREMFKTMLNIENHITDPSHVRDVEQGASLIRELSRQVYTGASSPVVASSNTHRTSQIKGGPEDCSNILDKAITYADEIIERRSMADGMFATIREDGEIYEIQVRPARFAHYKEFIPEERSSTLTSAKRIPISIGPRVCRECGKTVDNEFVFKNNGMMCDECCKKTAI